MTKATIFEGNVDDNLWQKLVFAQLVYKSS